MRVWNSEQLMCQLLVYGFIFSGMPLVSSLQTRITAHPGLAHLDLPVPPCCEQCSPNTFQWRDHAWTSPVVSSFLQFSILRVRSWAKWSSDKGAAGVHVRMAVVISGRWASRNRFDFFKWITVSMVIKCRLGSMVFCLHSVRHFADQLFEIVS